MTFVKPSSLNGADLTRFYEIKAKVPGWSGLHHQAFFKSVLEQLPFVTDILVAGVYQGRDISTILDLVERYHPGRALRIVGIDKFSDTPCDDWPQEKRGKDWQAAGFGTAPSLKLAMSNILKATGSNWGGLLDADGYALANRGALSFEIIQTDDAEWLAKTDKKFDLIYLDTSHDYATVKRQLQQTPRVAHENALIAGDDYSDQGTWGVKRAVSEAFTRHQVFAEWIWLAPRSELKT